MKKWIAVLSACVVLSVGATAVWAANPYPMRIFINGQEFKSDVPTQVVNNHTLVPLRAFSETIGAKVDWDRKTNMVHVEAPTTELLQKQIQELEQAVAPQSAEQAVQTYIKSLTTNNLPLQFAILSPELRELYRPHFENQKWNLYDTNTKVLATRIAKEVKVDDRTMQYLIDIDVPGEGGVGIHTNGAFITIKQTDNNTWLITEMGGHD